MATLENEFTDLMYDLHGRMAKEVNFRSSVLLSMIEKHGGVGAAKQLINAPQVSEGYGYLAERGRLDLTVEAVVLNHPEYHSLFTDRELKIAIKRLR